MTESIRINGIQHGVEYDTVFADLNGTKLQIVARGGTVDDALIGMEVLFSNENGVEFAVLEAKHHVVDEE